MTREKFLSGWRVFVTLALLLALMASAFVQITQAAVLSVPFFSQLDKRWKDDTGCAYTSVAMLLAYRCVDVDPGRLKTWLQANSGFDADGNLNWYVAANYKKGGWLKYDGAGTLPDLPTLRTNIDSGKRLYVARSERFSKPGKRVMHWVTIVGVDAKGIGWYLDPMDTTSTLHQVGDGWVNAGAEVRKFTY